MNLAYLVVFLPLIAALLSSVFAVSKPSKIPQLLTTGCIVVSAACSYFLFKHVVFDKNTYYHLIGNFFDIYGLTSNFVIRVDTLSSLMMVLITSVSACVHIYSIAYMHEDKNVNRFFSYLSMFTFFMLILVASDDFVQLFLGWEGVGLSSYLLISFWYKKDSASSAAIKAFVVNRVGDFGLILAIAFCYFTFNTINFTELAQILNQYLDVTINLLGFDINAITLISVLIFIGCMGKSAQFGLHVWLPDAMEGPTPVSALIHAATMVTAGIFLVVRCHYFFDASSFAQSLILIVSSITMIFAAVVAIFQNDIKKTIAYSTCSQLGHMFVACAVGRYDAGMFHLVTHGFFKALLFLSAGSVIHATHEQDMNNLPKSLHQKMPYTFILMLVGTLAITGFPPFAGYYSKDAIIESLSGIPYLISIITVFLTSFYSWKLIFKIFFSRNNHSDSHAHESSIAITGPMLFLAIFSITSGFVLVKYFGILNSISSVFWNNNSMIRNPHAEHASFLMENIPLFLSIAGFGFAYYFFMMKDFSLKSKIISNKFYIDEIYNFIFVKPLFYLANIAGIFDKEILDKYGPNMSRDLCYLYSTKLRSYHNGLLYCYNFWQFAVLIGLVVYFVSLALNIL